MTVHGKLYRPVEFLADVSAGHVKHSGRRKHTHVYSFLKVQTPVGLRVDLGKGVYCCDPLCPISEFDRTLDRPLQPQLQWLRERPVEAPEGMLAPPTDGGFTHLFTGPPKPRMCKPHYQPRQME